MPFASYAVRTTRKQVMGMKTKVAAALTTVGLLAAAGPGSASEFYTYVPGAGSLVNNNASGGAGFAPVSVTGYTGVGGQFNGNFYSDPTKPADRDLVAAQLSFAF